MLERGPDYGAGSATAPERIQVEMVSANPTGPITVASARNGAYGDSVARLLEFAGHDVEREYYYNDAGAQMDRFRASVEAAGRGEEPPEDGYHGEYVAELARLPGDPVERMRAQIEASLERFRIHFDSWALQSEMARHVPDVLAADRDVRGGGRAAGRATSSTATTRTASLVRSLGRRVPTYYAADVAYLRDKLDRGFDRAIYVLGADHHGYVARLRPRAALLGHDPERVEVLLYQLVHLTSGGEQAKMSKRRGDVVFLDDFVDEVGVDAARWYLVNRGPDQTIEIDVDLAEEKTQKNPVYYVQYAHARIAGHPPQRRRRGGRRPSRRRRSPPEERALVKRLDRLPGARARGDGAARAARRARVRDRARRRLPPLLPRAPRARERRAGVPARARAGDAARDRARSLDLVGVEAPERM